MNQFTLLLLTTYSVRETIAAVVGDCTANQKLKADDSACENCPDYQIRKGQSGGDEKECTAKTCAGADEGVKKDGTCAATRAACNGAGKASDFWYIDAVAGKQCKQRTVCDPTSNVIHVDGTCKADSEACVAFYEKKTGDDPKKCTLNTCADPKGIKADGTCTTDDGRTNCADDVSFLFIDTADERKCKRKTTTMCLAASADTKYVKVDGTCLAKCGDYTWGENADNKFECTDKKCKDEDPKLWTNFDGTCVVNGEACNAYSKKDGTDAKQCIKDAGCTSDKYLKTDGDCVATAADCPIYTRGDTVDTVKKCIADTCGDKVIDLTGVCVPTGGKCPNQSRTGADAFAKKCITDTCAADGDTPWKTLTGTCVASCSTESKTYADTANGKICKQDVCNALQVIQDDGTCLKCGDYIKANADNTACESEEFTCSGDRKYKSKVGTCLECDKFSVLGADGKTCVVPSCEGDTPVATVEGKCVAADKCPSYTKKNVAGTKCEEVDCSGEDTKKWLATTGVCVAKADCPAYSYGEDDDAKLCKVDVCPITSKLLTTGKCEACTEYQNAKADPKVCAATSCSGDTLKKTPDGLCHASCPEFFVAHDSVDNQCKAATDPCVSAEIDWFDDGGTCKEKCPEYDLADTTSATWKKCVSVSVDTCWTDGEKVLGRDGKCVAECPIYEKKNTSTKKCVAPVTCKDEETNKVLGVDGVCVDKCPDYQELDATDANDKKCKATKTSCHSEETNKIVGRDGKCTATCPDYEFVDTTGGITKKKCKAGPTNCADTDSKVLRRDGTCNAKCLDHEKKNTDTNKCDLVSCEKEETKKLLKKDGECAVECPDYDLIADDKCTTPAACAEGKKLHVDGKCKDACPEFYKDGSGDTANKCVLRENTCGTGDNAAKKYKKPDGDFSCVAACETYQFADATKKQCQTVSCESGQKLSIDGKCGAKCPEFFQEDVSPRLGKCVAVTNACASKSDGNVLLVASDSSCVATGKCPAYLKEDLANNKCVSVSCAEEETNKVLKLDGTCVAKCPDYELEGTGKKCEKVTCEVEGKKKLSLIGKCGAKCPEFSEDANDDGKCTAFTNTCKDPTKYQNGDKSCVAKCGDYLFTDATASRCATVVCEAEKVLKKDGTCAAKCSDYDKKNADTKRCETSVCDGATDKLLKKDGSCAAKCDVYDKIDADGKKCETPGECANLLTQLGACVEACPEFFKAGDGDNSKKCVDKPNACTEEADNKLMKPDGSTCVKTCDIYTFTDDTKKQCQTPVCGDKKVTATGKCVSTCPPLSAVGTGETAKKCVPKENSCSGDKPYFQDNADTPCVATCPENAYVRGFTDTANADKKSCVQDICGDNEVLKQADGTCIACGEYTKKKDDKTCAPDTCTGRNRLTKAGTCVVCEDFLAVKAGSDGKVCEQPLCKDGETEVVNKVVQADSTCKTCQNYYKAAANKRDCIPGVLTEEQPTSQWILQKDGTAKKCEYSKPDADKEEEVNSKKYNVECKATTCETDAAADAILRKKVAEDGSCVTCGDYEKRDPTDNKKCIKQTCSTKGEVPDLVAKCVDPQDTFIVALPEPPAGVTVAVFKENVKKARDDLKLMMDDVKKQLEVLQKSMTAQIKLAFGIV